MIVLNFINNELEVEIISTVGLSYLIFYVADVELRVSAVLAVVVMGLYMAKNKYCISTRVQVPITNTWHLLIYFTNILIFVITGIILAQSLVNAQVYIAPRDFGLSIVLYLVLHFARLVSIAVLYPFIRWSGVHLLWKEYVVLAWSGLRGSMALILVLLVKASSDIDDETKDRFLFHVCMIALLTLIINGTSSKFLIRFLGLHRGKCLLSMKGFMSISVKTRMIAY